MDKESVKKDNYRVTIGTNGNFFEYDRYKVTLWGDDEHRVEWNYRSNIISAWFLARRMLREKRYGKKTWEIR